MRPWRLRGIAWALMPQHGEVAALYAVTGKSFFVRMGYGDEWDATECKDEAHADRAILFLIQSMEYAGAVISAGPVEFELVGYDDAPVTSAQMIGEAAERALTVVPEPRATIRAPVTLSMRDGSGRFVAHPRATL